MNQQTKNLRLAERGAILAILTYTLLSTAKIIAGKMLSSSSLIADGFNNVSDIIANIAVLIGLRMARKPADHDHKFGHWKMEDLASLVTSLIMFFVGFDVLLETIQKIIANEEQVIDPLGACLGLISALIMLGVYLYNKQLAKRTHSKALEAAAKDNLSDIVTSLGTSIAIVASSLHFPIVDKLIAIVITFFILKTAYEIFMESSFSLSDGFDQDLLHEYEKAILEIPKVARVKSQRGRTYGSNIYLDLILEMSPDLSVYESHEIADQVEAMLHERFGVFDIDIHIEPTPIPEDEILDNVIKKLFLREQLIEQGMELNRLLAEDFLSISENGEELDKQTFQDLKEKTCPIRHFKLTSISQKTKMVRYEIDGILHTSIWRRHESWQLLFQQKTRIENLEQ